MIDVKLQFIIMFDKSLAAIEKYGVAANRAGRSMPVIIAMSTFTVFIHAILTHTLPL